MRKQSSTPLMRYARSWDVWPRRERVMRCVAAVCAERGIGFVRRVRDVCAPAPAPLRATALRRPMRQLRNGRRLLHHKLCELWPKLLVSYAAVKHCFDDPVV